jgi:hypothetical protein
MELAGAGSRSNSKQASRVAELQNEDLSRLAGKYSAWADMADRIRTGSVYEVQLAGTFGLLVTRDDPRTRRRGRPVLAPIHAHWPLFAPSVVLLTGHTTACSPRRCHGPDSCKEHAPITLGWPTFAAAYRAELEQRSLSCRLDVLCHILMWLRTYRTVTVLSFESGTPKDEAFFPWQQRGKLVPWAQRHICRDWLVSLLPLAASPGARQVRMPAGAHMGHLLGGGSQSPGHS